MSFLGPQLKINWGPKRTKAYPPPPRASESWGYGWSWGRSTSHQWGHASQFSRSGVSDSATPWTAACQASLSITNSRSLLKLMSVVSVMPSSHLILCRPLLLPSLFPDIRVFAMSQLFAWFCAEIASLRKLFCAVWSSTQPLRSTVAGATSFSVLFIF